MSKKLASLLTFSLLLAAGVGLSIGWQVESQIQVPPGLRAERNTWTPLMDVLKKDRPRVTDEQLARIAKYPIEALWNGVQNQGYTRNFANHFRLTQPGTKLVGRALTMRYLPLRPDIDAATKQLAKEGDWDYQYNVRAGEDAQPGDVIVVELGGAVDRATFLGDVTGIGMRQRGVRGVVVDGGIRDLNEFLVMKDFPIYYVNAHASAMADEVGVEWNAPIRIGHVSVLPGDVVVGDEEGVLFFPPQITEEVLKSAALTVNTENFKREMMRSGKYRSRDIYPKLSPELEKRYQEWLKTNPIDN
ncbi:MAG: RraA family protein [Blastocatellia bacterium]|jgi:regulator of RNase E activity RraA